MYVFLVIKMKNLRSKKINEGLTQWSSGQDSGLPWQEPQVRFLAGRARGFPGGLVVKTPPANAGDAGHTGLIPGSGRSPGEGNGNLLQYSCLGNPTDRGAWQATVQGVKKSWTE